MKRKYGNRLNGEQVQLVAHEVIEVSRLPVCDFCQDGTLAEYDFKSRMGPWGNGCAKHWIAFAASPKLGTGYGQMLVASETVHEVISAS
jgi:hypothetical protein